MLNIKKYILLLLVVFITQGCMVKTNETEMAVKIRYFNLFGKNGVDEEVYAPGRYHFFIPLFSSMQKYDTRLRTIKMTFNPTTGDRRRRDDLLFKTIDGNDISLDVIIQYRIIPEKAPYIIQYVAQNDIELKETIIRVLSRSKPRDIFGELKTEEFYNANAREEKSEQVKTVLNKILNPFGVAIESVLTEDYRFNKAYQKAIEDKKIADQLAEKNKSATFAAIEEYKRKLEEAQGEVNIVVAHADGEFSKAKIEADAYYKKMKFIASAIKKEGNAKARGLTKLNQALAGSGGRTMVKLEIAKAIQGKKIILLPLSEGGMNLKTTDVNSLLSTYGLKNLSDKSKQ